MPPVVPQVVPRPLEGHWYRTALMLCPPVFRREHGDEMSRDFDELHGEAASRGHGALWTLRLVMAIDLVRTAGVQWVRTGLPLVAFISIAIQLAVGEAIARITRRAVVLSPGRMVNDEAEVMAVLIAAVTILVIAMTIVLNLWVTRLNRRRSRRR